MVILFQTREVCLLYISYLKTLVNWSCFQIDPDLTVPNHSITHSTYLADCHQSGNVISFSLSQRDHIKQLPLYYCLQYLIRLHFFRSRSSGVATSTSCPTATWSSRPTRGSRSSTRPSLTTGTSSSRGSLTAMPEFMNAR